MGSVRAEEIFLFMVVGGSVRRMRDRGEGCDLDIFCVGFWSDIMRFVGAERGLV